MHEADAEIEEGRSWSSHVTVARQIFPKQHAGCVISGNDCCPIRAPICVSDSSCSRKEALKRGIRLIRSGDVSLTVVGA